MLRIAIFSFVLVCSVFASPVSPGGRIVGGTDADITAHPYQASLFYNGRHNCGGSIIGANTILTAAHCVYGFNEKLITIVAGVTRLTEAKVQWPISKTIIHEDYDPYTANYDFAIIVLKDNLDVNSTNMKQIELAEILPAVGAPVIVTGWGTLSEGGLLPDNMQKVELALVAQKSCNRVYNQWITDSMFCAGVPLGGKDSCQGDSGGPLTADGKLVGVVSWGNGCGRKGYPGVYASVPEGRGWIIKTVNENAN